MLKDLSSERTPSLAMTLAVVTPITVDAVGARWILPVAVPVPESMVVTVMYSGPEPFKNVSGSPPASVA